METNQNNNSSILAIDEVDFLTNAYTAEQLIEIQTLVEIDREFYNSQEYLDCPDEFEAEFELFKQVEAELIKRLPIPTPAPVQASKINELLTAAKTFEFKNYELLQNKITQNKDLEPDEFEAVMQVYRKKYGSGDKTNLTNLFTFIFAELKIDNCIINYNAKNEKETCQFNFSLSKIVTTTNKTVTQANQTKLDVYEFLTTYNLPFTIEFKHTKHEAVNAIINDRTNLDEFTEKCSKIQTLLVKEKKTSNFSPYKFMKIIDGTPKIIETEKEKETV